MLLRLGEGFELPNSAPEKRNLWPRLLFNWKIVICVIAPRMNRNKNTAVMGMSSLTVGMAPSDHVVGIYGPCFGSGIPPEGCCDVRFIVFHNDSI